MRKVVTLLVAGLVVVAGAYADSHGPPPSPPPANQTTIDNTLQAQQHQTQIMKGQGYAYAEGGKATAEGGDASAGAVALTGDTSSDADASVSISSTSNYRQRTPPISTLPPYLPYWTHGGWGTLKAYFPNGPAGDDQVYERAFNPADPDDMRELRGVLGSLSYDGPLETFGGIINSVATVLGGPDNFHHGRGFEIANAFIRDRRPSGKPLLVFIDTNVDRGLLQKAGYAYVGRVSLEGDIDRNWDHVYDAAIAEALPWDVDVLLISGGMKGVTIGSTVAFPGGAGGYSQVNYSISLFGGVSSGITEAKGKAVVSAEGYRYWPEAASRRRIPKFLYDKFRARPTTGQTGPTAVQGAPSATKRQMPPGIEVSQQLYDMAGFHEGQRVQNLSIK